MKLCLEISVPSRPRSGLKQEQVSNHPLYTLYNKSQRSTKLQCWGAGLGGDHVGADGAEQDDRAEGMTS